MAKRMVRIDELTAEELDQQTRVRRKQVEQIDADIERFGKADPKNLADHVMNMRTFNIVSPKVAIRGLKKIRERIAGEIERLDAEAERRAVAVE